MFKHLEKINQQIYDISASITVLGNVSWPLQAEVEFLTAYQKGQWHLPKIQYSKVDYSDLRNQLQKLRKSFTAHHPLEDFTQKTIESYLLAIELNLAIGTPDFTEISKKMYGTPQDLLPNTQFNSVMAAEKLVELADKFDHPYIHPPEFNVQAVDVKNYLERRIEGVFHHQGPEVVITEGLSAKATATARTIKLRAGTNFTHYDFKQLFYHEVMTHALTALNGEAQPILKSIGRGAPRTLKTQEGLATFAEVITGSIDIYRLKRLALRVLAIDMALKGASFVEVFQYFISKHQSPKESFAATHRIFRGGFPDKNILFTKDCVYLDGLMNIHLLFQWAMTHNRLELSHLLFCGRLSLEDIFELEEAYKNQWIAAPQYLPAWYSKIEGLAGSLSFSLLANILPMDLAEQKYEKVD